VIFCDVKKFRGFVGHILYFLLIYPIITSGLEYIFLETNSKQQHLQKIPSVVEFCADHGKKN
jgi:hypothetical protein